MGSEELNRIISASTHVRNNTKLGRPEWIWKDRQTGFERLRSRKHFESMMFAMFSKESNVDRDVFALAVKIIKGDRDFSSEELQLQMNESEALEKKLLELKEWISKRDKP